MYSLDAYLDIFVTVLTVRTAVEYGTNFFDNDAVMRKRVHKLCTDVNERFVEAFRLISIFRMICNNGEAERQFMSNIVTK